MRGGTRVFFVAGMRLRQRLAEHEARNARLRGILDTGDEELPVIVRLKLEQLQIAQRRIRALEEELADSRAAELAVLPQKLVESHFEGLDSATLARIARAVVARAPDKVAFLTASSGEAHLVVLAAGEQCLFDVPAVGRQVLEILEGRGGGSGRMVQGKFANPSGRTHAVSFLRNAITR
jgi:alanyl-tRNA synthetase